MTSKIYMETFGCSFNQASSEIMQGILLDNNYQLVVSIEDSNVIILNSCIVKTNTEARILNRIKEYSKSFSQKGIIVTGCMPEVLAEEILQINPKISMLGPHNITDILKAVQLTLQSKPFVQIGKRKEIKLCLPRTFQNSIIAKVQIAQGCLNNCAYCITKHAMGTLYSYPMDEILQEIQHMLNRGCKEVWLTAQDTGCYGFDSSHSLPELLAKIVQIPSEFRIRVGMMNPSSFQEISKELIQIYKNTKIYNFIHIPIQSGNDEILAQMNRKYSILEIKGLIANAKKEIPDLALSLDIIVGFPSETDDQFEDTISAIKQIRPDIVNISKFGARPKTIAAKLKPLSSKIVKKRSTRLSHICAEIAQHQNHNYLKRFPEPRVLAVAHGKKGGVLARAQNYKPVVLKNTYDLGRFYNVKLIESKRSYLLGEVIDDFPRDLVL